jgi:branched-chain amino acid transport system ATP-binding protein
MLALVRAFASGAKVVLVDEASLGLAPIVAEQIFESLRRLAAAGVALLLVEQYITKALELAKIAYVLTRGSIVFSGPSSELQRQDVFDRYFGIESTPS